MSTKADRLLRTGLEAGLTLDELAAALQALAQEQRRSVPSKVQGSDTTLEWRSPDATVDSADLAADETASPHTPATGAASLPDGARWRLR